LNIRLLGSKINKNKVEKIKNHLTILQNN